MHIYFSVVIFVHIKQVCNHPELFERGHAISPYAFIGVPATDGHIKPKPGVVDSVRPPFTNAIDYPLPRMIYEEGQIVVHNRNYCADVTVIRGDVSHGSLSHSHFTALSMSVFLPDNINSSRDDGFAFMYHMEHSTAEVSEIALSTFSQRCLLYLLTAAHAVSNAYFTGLSSKKFVWICIIWHKIDKSGYPDPSCQSPTGYYN